MSFLLSPEFLFALRVGFKGVFGTIALVMAYVSVQAWAFAIKELKKPADRTLPPPTAREWAAVLVLLIGPPMFFTAFLYLAIRM